MRKTLLAAVAVVPLLVLGGGAALASPAAVPTALTGSDTVACAEASSNVNSKADAAVTAANALATADMALDSLRDAVVAKNGLFDTAFAAFKATPNATNSANLTSAASALTTATTALSNAATAANLNTLKSALDSARDKLASALTAKNAACTPGEVVPIAQICAATGIEQLDEVLGNVAASRLLTDLKPLAGLAVPKSDSLTVVDAVQLNDVKKKLNCGETVTTTTAVPEPTTSASPTPTVSPVPTVDPVATTPRITLPVGGVETGDGSAVVDG